MPRNEYLYYLDNLQASSYCFLQDGVLCCSNNYITAKAILASYADVDVCIQEKKR